MAKTGIYLVLLMFTTTAAAAEQGRIDVANVDKDLRLHMEKSVLPQVIEKYEYYEIRGGDERELRGQMSRNGTKWDDGKTYDAVTRWNWKWDYEHDRRPEGGCSVESFRTTVQITFRYPKWVQSDGHPQPLLAKWDGYIQNLAAHEKGHRDMAVEAAAEFVQAVEHLAPAATCEDLDRQVNALSRERMARLNAASVEYDVKTKHGATQGAVFP